MEVPHHNAHAHSVDPFEDHTNVSDAKFNLAAKGAAKPAPASLNLHHGHHHHHGHSHSLDSVPLAAPAASRADPYNAMRTDVSVDDTLFGYYAASLCAIAGLDSRASLLAGHTASAEAVLRWVNDAAGHPGSASAPSAAAVRDVFASDPAGHLIAVVARAAHKARLEPGSYAVSLVHLGRLLKDHPSLSLSAVNAARMALVSLMVASKCVTDVPYSNKYWARISGEFTLDDINAMEAELVTLVGWGKLQVRDEEYAEIEDCAVRYAQASAGVF